MVLAERIIQSTLEPERFFDERHCTKTHEGLIAKFVLAFIDKCFIERTPGKALNVAKDDREDVDHSIICKINEEEAEKFLEQIKAVIKQQ